MKEIMVDPQGIETKSMEIISEILGETSFSYAEEKVLKRVIHTSADFEYKDMLEFHHQPIEAIMRAIKDGINIVTDTKMALAGINKKNLQKHGIAANCFISEPEIAAEAKKNGVTRAIASMEWACKDPKNGIFVIGNAPTALYKLIEMTEQGLISPQAIIGVPVGFVGALESKELLATTKIPSILSRSRKGGSNIAAAIVNAILLLMEEEKN